MFFIFVTLIFVMKHSRRWRPPIGGGKMFEPPFWSEKSNLSQFFCKISLPGTLRPPLSCFQPPQSPLGPPGTYLQDPSMWWLLLNWHRPIEEQTRFAVFGEFLVTPTFWKPVQWIRKYILIDFFFYFLDWTSEIPET